MRWRLRSVLRNWWAGAGVQIIYPPKPGQMYHPNGFPGVVLVCDDGDTFLLNSQTGPGWVPYELPGPVSSLRPYGEPR